MLLTGKVMCIPDNNRVINRAGGEPDVVGRPGDIQHITVMTLQR